MSSEVYVLKKNCTSLTYKQCCIRFYFWPHAFEESDCIHDVEINFVCKILNLYKEQRADEKTTTTTTKCSAYNEFAEVIEKVAIE